LAGAALHACGDLKRARLEAVDHLAQSRHPLVVVSFGPWQSVAAVKNWRALAG
jgi:hypothetical protein